MDKKKVMFISLSVFVLALILVLIIRSSFAVELEDGARVAPESELTYYIDVIYDGKDANAVTSSDTATANVRSDYIYVEDKIPDGLTFKGFVTTSDGTIGAVKRSDGTSCPGYVVGDSAGLTYDEATRTVSFKVKNLQAGCKLTVGIITVTPSLESNKRIDFYNTALARENDFSIKSNTVHAFMGDDEATLYTVTYSYSGTVPDGAPSVPIVSSYSPGSSVFVESAPNVSGYTFSGWSSSDVTVSNGSFTMPTKNITFTGSFTAKTKRSVTYTISGDAPEGFTPPNTKSYGAGDEVKIDSLKAGDVINGYRFLGWTTTNVTVSDGYFTMPNSNVTFTCSFERISYTVTYSFMGTNIPDESLVSAPAAEVHYPGDIVKLPTVSDVTGYKFLGWYSNDNFVMPESDVYIAGEWKKYNGTFEPNISIEILDKSEVYKNGDVVKFLIRVKNTASFSITDVMVQEEMDGVTFKNASDVLTTAEMNSLGLDFTYTVLNDKFVRVDSMSAGTTVGIIATYTASNVAYQSYANAVTLTGALAEDDYFLNTDKDYKVSTSFIVSNIKLSINLTGKDDKVLTQGEFTLYKDSAVVGTGVEFTGLVPGTYVLKQTRAHTGYTILPDSYSLVVDSDGNITMNGNKYTIDNCVVTIDLQNDEINMLPNTGGVGNIPYVVIGSIIIIISSLGYVQYLKKKEALI